MKDRIVKLLEFTKITPAEFADQIGIQRSSLSHVMTGRNYPGYVFIQKILEAFPQLNSRWLLTGQGNMFDEGKPPSVTPQTNVNAAIQGDLFAPAINQEPVVSQSEKIVEEKQVRDEDQAPYFSGYQQKPERKSVFSQPDPIHPEKEVTKVLIFYRDRTFEEYKPA